MPVMDFPTAPVNGQTTSDGRYYFDSTVGTSGAWRSAPLPVGGLPAGSIIQWSSNTAPANWLICDGAAVSRVTYSSLFAVIGTTYGAGNGSTTFNLPDLRGRVAVGRDGSQTEFDALGESGGAKTHTLTVDQMPSHNHLYYSYLGAGAGGTIDNKYVAGANASGGVVTASTFAHNKGGDQAHNNLQPYLVTNYIIKATAGWTAGDSELATRLGAVEAKLPSTGLTIANGGTGATTLAGAQAALGVSVLQAVSNTTDVEVITTSSTFVSGGLTATITPSSTSSKVLILCSTGVSYNTRSNFGVVSLFRGTTSGTDLGDSGGFGLTVLYPSAAATNLTNFAATVLDSPGTTSPQTYTLAIKTSGGGTINTQASGSKGSMVLLEVRG